MSTIIDQPLNTPLPEALGMVDRSLTSVLGLVIVVTIESHGEYIDVPYEIMSWNSYTCKYMAKPTSKYDVDLYGEIYFNEIMIPSSTLQQIHANEYDAIYVDENDEFREDNVHALESALFIGSVLDENGKIHTT
jgi:hypothetical protein